MKNKIGRNDPCPCGCGRKFKVCLAEKREARDAVNRERNAARMKQAKRALSRLTATVAIIAGETIARDTD